MYLPLALEMYNRLFIDSLGLLAVYEIKKHLFQLIQLNCSRAGVIICMHINIVIRNPFSEISTCILTVALISARTHRERAKVSICD